MREYELAAEMDAAMQSLGSEDNFGLMAAGAHNVAIRAVTDRKLEPGDVIVGEITPCYRGYFAQLCRTLILGEPSDLQREKYDLLLRAQAAGLSVAKAGLPSAGIAKAVNQVIGAAGYAEYCRQPYMRTRGHGLGMGGIVPYDVTEDSSPVLTEKMTMVIHPNQYIPETGYMMLGDTVVIEKNGPRTTLSAGTLDTNKWVKGKQYVEKNAGKIPSDLPPGTYEVRLSLRDAKRDRLIAVPVKDCDAEGRFSVGAIEVK